MKIVDIHKTTDFWDWAGQGVDPHIVFDRSGQSVTELHTRLDAPEDALMEWGTWENGFVLRVEPVFVLVAGTAFCAVKTLLHWHQGWGNENKHHHNRTSLLETLTTHLGQDALTAGRGRDASPQQKRFERKIKAILDWLDNEPRDITGLSIEHGLVVGELVRSPRLDGDKEETWVFTPLTLQSLGFVHVLAPEDIHMQVARFVGGVLTQPQDIPPVPDRVKIAKHGFDTKVSFRRRHAQAEN